MITLKKISYTLALAAVLGLSGCGSSGSSSSDSTQGASTEDSNLSDDNGSSSSKVTVKVFTPKEISMRSNQDYNDNQYGVITAERLKKYLENWKENKPEGVEGRLVVLQAGRVGFDNNATFLPHNDQDVFVYEISAGGACDPSYKRFDGISYTPGAMVSGERIDQNINYFQLDPMKDFVVFAVANGSTTIREITRTWWSLVYWGWDLKRLAFLNGSVAYNFANQQDYLVAKASTPPQMKNMYHMHDLRTDRTALHIYMDEMKVLAKDENKTGYFLIDARGTTEYNGTKKAKSASKVCGPNHDEQCYTAFTGHIKGAIDFPYTDILVMDDNVTDLNGDGVVDGKDASFKFKSYDALKALYTAKGYKEGDMVVAYCRTGRKATLAALTSTTVLGYPFRMYDGSWMQWGEMAYALDVNGTYILPEFDPNDPTGEKPFPLLNDVPSYSEVLAYTDPDYTEPASTYQIDLNSTTSQQIVKEDKAYLRLGL